MVWYDIFKDIPGIIIDKLLLKLGYKSNDGTVAGVVVNIGTINFPNTGANLIIVGMLTVIILQQRKQIKQDQENGGKKEKKNEESTTKPTSSTSQEQNQDQNKEIEISETDKMQEGDRPMENPLKPEDHKLKNQQQDKLINQEKKQDQPRLQDGEADKQELNPASTNGNQNKETEISETDPKRPLTKEERKALELLIIPGLLRSVDFFLNVGFPTANLQNDKNVTKKCFVKRRYNSDF